jgi:DNA-3-methyladenine glycosylase
MTKRLDRDFFDRPAEIVAPELLGKFLVRNFSDGFRQEGMITEVEAYVGTGDLASHAAGGRRTKRNEIMYGPPGRAYVYFTYGMHWLLNLVTSRVNDPQAVLIRGLDSVSGPARLTKLFRIDKELNGEDLVKSETLWLEDRGTKIPPGTIERTPRVGVGYAGEWKNKPLRFVVNRR